MRLDKEYSNKSNKMSKGDNRESRTNNMNVGKTRNIQHFLLGSSYAFRKIKIVNDKLFVLDPSIGVVILNKEFNRINIIPQYFTIGDFFVSESGGMLALVSYSGIKIVFTESGAYYIHDSNKDKGEIYIEIYDLKCMKSVLSLRSNIEPKFIEFSPDERLVLIGFGSSRITLIDIYKEEKREISFVDDILDAKWIDDKRLLLLHGNMEYLLYNLKNDLVEREYSYEGRELVVSFIDRKRNYLYYLLRGANKIIGLNYETGRKRKILGFKYVVNNFVFVPKLDIIVAQGDNYILRIFDVSTGKWIKNKAMVFLERISFDASESLIYISYDDKKYLYSTKELRPISEYVREEIKEIATNNDELAVLYNDNVVKIWSISDRKITNSFNLKGSNSIVYVKGRLFISSENKVLMYDNNELKAFKQFNSKIEKLINAGELLLALLDGGALYGVRINNNEVIKLGNNVKVACYDEWNKRLAIARYIDDGLIGIKVVDARNLSTIIDQTVKMENVSRLFLIANHLIVGDAKDITIYKIMGTKLLKLKEDKTEDLKYLNNGVLTDNGKIFVASSLRKELMVIESETLRCIKKERMMYYIRKMLYQPQNDLIIAKTSASDIILMKKSEIISDFLC